MTASYIEALLEKVNSAKRIWDTEPVFCFTSDIDWASEAVLERFFEVVNPLGLKPTLFVTNHSDRISESFDKGLVARGIHPNFLEGSSHGDNFRDVVETCIDFAPEAIGFRSHRLFDVTDITHMLKNDFGFKYVSNLGTIFKTGISPIVHESGLLHYPIFFEDGTHLYNRLNLNVSKYEKYLAAPGIKIISFHPINFVFNAPDFGYLRSIMDTISREEYQAMGPKTIEAKKNCSILGIGDTVLQIVDFVKSRGHRIMTLDEIYQESIE